MVPDVDSMAGDKFAAKFCDVPNISV